MNIQKKQIIENLLEALRVSWESKSTLKSSQIAEEIEAVIVNQFGTDREIDVYKKIEAIKNGGTSVLGAPVISIGSSSSLSADDFAKTKKKTNTALPNPAAEVKSIVSVNTKRADKVTDDEITNDNDSGDDNLDLAMEILALQDEEITTKFGTYPGVKNFAEEVFKISLPQKKVDGLKLLRDELKKIVDADNDPQGGQDQ